MDESHHSVLLKTVVSLLIPFTIKSWNSTSSHSPSMLRMSFQPLKHDVMIVSITLWLHYLVRQLKVSIERLLLSAIIVEDFNACQINKIGSIGFVSDISSVAKHNEKYARFKDEHKSLLNLIFIISISLNYKRCLILIWTKIS